MRTPAIRVFAALASACAIAAAVFADTQVAVGSSPHVRLVAVSHFAFPIYIASTPADPHGIYVLERAGRIYVIRNGHRVFRPFLDLRKDIRIAHNSEQGLISMAFAPDYGKSRLFYVYYTNVHGDIRVVQFKRSATHPNRAIPTSARTILALPHPMIAHYAGQLQFDRDGNLNIGIGDGGGVGDPANNAQNLGNLYGKIIRIRPNPGGRRPYLIPRNNPFRHRPGARPEILDYGLRNPYRFSFDSLTGSIWIGDVGENNYEEVDYRPRRHIAGVNFGWSRYEGYSLYDPNRAAPGAVFPILVEAHSGGTSGSHETWCALIGGYVVRTHTLPSLYGAYLFADHCKGGIYLTRLTRTGQAFDTGPTGLVVPGFVTSFGVDAQQRVYVASEDDYVYRIVGG